ncbi:MAG: hypothetical protein K2Q11_10305 [Burkholderiaceae bacterium]|nr:hypothetical protein [Burkholderiaceae bacterium]
MARRLEYTGTPVLTSDDVAAWLKCDTADLESALVVQTIIPSVTAQCEARTGAAIREAIYEEQLCATHAADGCHDGYPLDIGQAKSVVSVNTINQDGTTTPVDTPFFLRQGQRESRIFFPAGRPSVPLQIRYVAGVDLVAYPSVRAWMLLQAGTLHAQRESLIVGAVCSQMPHAFLDEMLSEITVPPRF